MQMKIKQHNLNQPYIPDHPYRILIIGGSGKTNAFFNLINKQPGIDKIYLYAKDPFEAIYQIHKRESIGLKHFNDPKAFIGQSNDMQDVYKNIDEYNPRKKRKTLVVFDDMIGDMINNKKLNSIVTELLFSVHFSCFYYTIIFSGSKRCQAKFYSVFHYENSEQKRTSTNCAEPFIKH